MALGGALGAALRYYLGGTVLARTAAPFPTATFVINVTGSFAVGLFLTLATERLNLSPHVRLAVAVGLLAVWLGIFAARKLGGARPAGADLYRRFELSADARDTHQSPGAERDIRDSTVERG